MDTAALQDDTADDAMTRTPANYDESQQSTAGQQEGASDCNLVLKDGVGSVLPKVTMVTNSLEGLTDADKDERGAAGYDTRMLAMKADLGSHIGLEAAATSKEDRLDNCVRGGNEDGMTDPEC